MKYLWRCLTQRCTSCGQKLKSKQTITERIAKLNTKSTRLTKRLGRKPQTQNCRQCQKMLFEGESGFMQNCLLLEMEEPSNYTLYRDLWAAHKDRNQELAQEDATEPITI